MNAAQVSSGTFKRMRTFLDALRERMSVSLLLYASADREQQAAARAFLKSAWDIDDRDVVICPEDADAESGNMIWNGYLSRALSIHRQFGYACTSGISQVRAFEQCLQDKPDLIFVHRLHAMCPLLRTRKPTPPVFFDLDDVEHRSLLRRIPQSPVWRLKKLYYLQVPALLAGERRAVKLSRKTFVCSEYDQQYLSQTWRLPNVSVVPNSIHVPPVTPFQREPVMLFLGTYAYKPNANAADELISLIWPIVRRACPDAKLLIAGEMPERIPSFGRPQRGVEYTGFVPDLESLYARVRVVCCPIRAGGGTRIKIIEAAAHRKPVVATTIGAEGLRFENGREILLCDEPEAFAAACLRLLTDDAAAMKLGEAARAKVIELYDRRSVMARIQAEILGASS